MSKSRRRDAEDGDSILDLKKHACPPVPVTELSAGPRVLESGAPALQESLESPVTPIHLQVTACA